MYDTHLFNVNVGDEFCNFLSKFSKFKQMKNSEHSHPWSIQERKRPTGPHTLGWADITGRKDYVSREGCILRALLKSRVSDKSFATRVSLSSASTRRTETWHVQLPGAVFHWSRNLRGNFFVWILLGNFGGRCRWHWSLWLRYGLVELWLSLPVKMIESVCDATRYYLFYFF